MDRSVRFLASVATALMGVMTLAACGDGGGSAGSGSTRASASASTDPALNALLPAAIRKSGVVKLATDAEYPPCESTEGGSKTMVGYEPDLWNAMAAELGIRVDATSITFDSLIPGVQGGRYDMAMECISDNTEREKQVTFVDDAYATGAVYTLASDTSVTADPLSLCGLSTGTQQGLDLAEQITTTLDPHCAKAGKPAISVHKYPTANAALLALYSGRVDFVLNDYAAADAMKKAAPKPIRMVTDPLLQKYYNGMIFKKGATQLQQAFLGALKSLVASGEYAKIMKKWDLEDLQLTQPGVDLAAREPILAPTP